MLKSHWPPSWQSAQAAFSSAVICVPRWQRCLGQDRLCDVFNASGSSAQPYWVGYIAGYGSPCVFDTRNPSSDGMVNVVQIDDLSIPRLVGLRELTELIAQGTPVIDPVVHHACVRAYLTLAGTFGAKAPSVDTFSIRQRDADLRNLFLGATRPRLCFRTRQPIPDLQPSDVELALMWYQGRNRTAIGSELRSGGIKRVARFFPHDLELARLLSARAAERAAWRYYSQLGYQVVDVAISQLNGPSSVDEPWTQYDLVATAPGTTNGQCLDVKNARRAATNNGVVSRQTVPRFKRGRAGNDVWIVGVLSPQMSVGELLGQIASVQPHMEFCSMLGWTHWSQLQMMIRSFAAEQQLNLRPLRAASPGGFALPPWAYDSPKELYGGSAIARRQLRDALNNDEEARRILKFYYSYSDVPLDIAFGNTLSKYENPSWQSSFVESIAAAIAKHDHKLLAVYLSVLTHFVKMVASDDLLGTRGYSPSFYHRALWIENTYADRGRPARWFPLGIYDPEESIFMLVEALSALWGAEREHLRQYDQFTLLSWNILAARRRDDGTRQTVLAYCGGGPGPEAACGKFPLVAGVHPHCQAGKLICPDCNYCCESCQQRETGLSGATRDAKN